MGSLKNKPPQPPVKRTKEESDERARSLKEFGTEDFTELNRSADAIFDAAWNVVKADDDRPDWPELPREKLGLGIRGPDWEYTERVHRNPQGHEIIEALRNNPSIMDMIGEDGENLSAINPPIHTCKNCGKETATEGPMGRDVWDDDYCSKNCSEGNDPTCRDHGKNCQWEIEQMPTFDSNISDMDDKRYQIEVACPVCGDSKWGYVS